VSRGLHSRHVRAFWLVALPVALPFAALGAGCDAILGIEELSTPTQQQFQCQVPTDCPGAGNACFTRECNGGTCQVAELGANQPVSSQIAGDCKLVVCNEDGTTREDADPTDLPNDGRECTDDACDGTTPTSTNKTPGTQCTGGVCNNAGDCVECVVAAQCTGGKVCVMNQCVAATCTDGVKNGDETAKDCGGSCPKCDDGKACLDDGDCKSGNCAGSGTKTCQAPSCNDSKLNGNETDVDCGGGDCPACDHGKLCMNGSDCQSLVCSCPASDPTCAMPTCQVGSCDDGVMNGTEVAVDCGPTCLGQCQTDDPCLDNNWCLSGVCDNDVCQAPTCTDQVKNGTETGIDCGGGTCPPCG
jgi:hypothetical protein